jgi:hypothetical protein
MKPSEVSNTLRRIATKIDNSVNPKKNLVAKDLRRIIMAIGKTPKFAWANFSEGPWTSAPLQGIVQNIISKLVPLDAETGFPESDPVGYADVDNAVIIWIKKDEKLIAIQDNAIMFGSEAHYRLAIKESDEDENFNYEDDQADATEVDLSRAILNI